MARLCGISRSLNHRFTLVVLVWIAVGDVVKADVRSSHSQSTDPTAVLDDKGYVIYCPCMGRFGNQADHLLGSLSFANRLDRTLVLPAWPTLRGFVEFDQWFNLEVLSAYHRVITADVFMKTVAPTVWPPGRRVGFCYQPSQSGDRKIDRCDLKLGSPFGPFWDNLNVDFDSTLFYNLTFSKGDVGSWNSIYPAAEYPVLAFKGAPATFPVKSEDVALQKYLWWTEEMVEEASHLIYGLVGDAKYIAVHLRNGADWVKACEYAAGTTTFMSSPQCLGYDNKKPITQNMCLPDISHITKRLRDAVLMTNITHIYILTDQFALTSEIEEKLSDLGVKVVHGDPDIAQLDLIIAAKAELFVGNCISSFSAFVVRERRLLSVKPSWFFGVESTDR